MNTLNEIKNLLDQITEKLENYMSNMPDNPANLKVKSVFCPFDRLEEYVKEIGDLPRINDNINYWQMAKDLCKKDGGHLASMDELAQIANYIYNTDVFQTKTDNCDLGEGAYDSTKAEKFGFPSSPGFIVWSSDEGSVYYAYNRYFNDNGSVWDNYGRNYSRGWAVCLGD